MAETNYDSLINQLMEGMDGFLSTKTVVGEPTRVGETIIVPLVDVSFGVACGAAKGTKSNGGAGGLSGKMTPSAVLVMTNGHTRLVNIKNQDSITKIIDLVPDVLDRISVKKNKDGVTDSNAVETAFPKEEEN